MKRTRARVGLDVDGVLADFHTPFLEILNNVCDSSYTIDHISDWDLDLLIPQDKIDTVWSILGQPGFVIGLKPFKEAQEAFRSLSEISDIYIVTSHLHGAAQWVYEREKWLVNHFGIPRGKHVHTKCKYVFNGDMLVDDKPKNVEQWAPEYPNGVGILWTAHYNKDHNIQSPNIKRTNSWQDVIEEVKNINKQLI